MAYFRQSAFALVVLAACQVASTSSAGEGKANAVMANREVRLPERTLGAPPPTLAPPSYAVDDRELLQNTDRLQRVSASTAVKLPAAALIAGRSYRLTFTAHALSEGDAKVGIKFRELKNSTFRSFEASVTGTAARPYQLEFTAPAYTAAAELAVDLVGGAALEIDSLSLRMRSALSRTAPVSSWAGSFVPDGYGLVFNDEFEGSELDRHKWFTRYIYSSEQLDRLNDENERYADDGNQRLAGGVLYLTAKRLKLSQPSGVNYESGMIRSDFTARYGFFEARVKMPGGLGVWPAFWLNSDVSAAGRLAWPPEIDIFEFVNNGKDDKVNEIHSSTTDTPGRATEFRYVDPHFKTNFRDYVAPFDFNAGWHTIGAEWTPTEVSIYVDGLKVVTTSFQWEYADGTLAAPAHVLLNLAIGDKWAGRYGIDDSAFPQALAVDWVRVYQKT